MPTPDADSAALRDALAGQYLLERELGRGGMGVVHLARDVHLDRHVAIKSLPPALGNQVDLRERFLREARTAAALSHPHIVPIYRADELGGHAFFVMAFVDGESLADRVRDRGPLPPAEAVRWLREVAWALAYAHARGVVHRDIKPENIMIERGSGRALVTDFGIARADHDIRLTADGHVLGTVHYMSPEQLSGDALDGRSDLYALGVVGFFALSGHLPFDGAAHAVLVAHATQPPPPLAMVAPQVPRAIAAVIDRCLAKNPADRWPTGEALAEALGKALADAETADATSGAHAMMSETEAEAVWRRAAQLQAEAAQRLEAQARRHQLPAARSADVLAPTQGYRVRDVEAAALEVGISRQFVAVALAEAQASQGEGKAPKSEPLADWQERVARRVLGSSQRSMSESRVVRAAPRRALQAAGRVLQGHPYNLELRETLGAHPLDGGVLVFDLPAYTGMETGGYKWMWTRYGVYANQLRVTLRPLPSEPAACEVTLHLDLRRGVKGNLWGLLGASGGMAAGGGAAGVAIGVKALALGGAAVLIPGALAAIVVGAGSAAGWAGMYRWGMRRAALELQRALAAIDNDVRAEELFGAPVTRAVQPARASWGDVVGMG